MKLYPSLLERALGVADQFLADFHPPHYCFLQDDLSVANASGATVRADINNNLQALGTLFAGASAPGTTWANMWWADTTNNVLWRRNNANTNWFLRGTLDSAGVVAKSANYTAVLSDFGKTLNCTGTWTLSLTAAATLSDGWCLGITNSGTGIVTIDPNSTETIDGQTTVTVQPGATLWIVCNGTLFRSIAHRTALVSTTKTVDYTAVWDDRGQMIVMNKSTAITLNLTAAATLGPGWYVYVKNIGLGPLTLDANASETIDGELTKLLATGQSCLLQCDGSNFRTISENGSWSSSPTIAQSGTASITTAQALGHVHIYTSTGGHTLTLPAANWSAGGQLTVVHAGTGTLTVARAGSDTLALGTISATSLKLKPGDAYTLRANGSSAWNIVASHTRDYETISGHIETPQNKTYYIVHKMLKAGRVVAIHGKSATGTTTLTVKVNGSTTITFSGTLSFSTGQDFTATGSNTFAAGDEITFVLSASGTEFRFSLDVEYDTQG